MMCKKLRACCGYTQEAAPVLHRGSLLKVICKPVTF